MIELSSEDRKTLEGWARAGTTETRMAELPSIILAAAQGESTAAFAERLQTRQTQVSKRRNRFAREGIEGLHDALRHGCPVR